MIITRHIVLIQEYEFDDDVDINDAYDLIESDKVAPVYEDEEDRWYDDGHIDIQGRGW